MKPLSVTAAHIADMERVLVAANRRAYTARKLALRWGDATHATAEAYRAEAADCKAVANRMKHVLKILRTQVPFDGGPA
jgi:hypothetical protein